MLSVVSTSSYSASSEVMATQEEIDPLGLLDEPTLIGSSMLPIIKDMVKDEQYLKEEHLFEEEQFKDNSFIVYTLFPSYSYMGADEGLSYIAIYTGYDSDIITMFHYSTLWDKANIGTLISSIRRQCGYFERLFGDYEDCTYTSLILYPNSEIRDTTIDELCTEIETLTQGIYAVQWVEDEHRYTINTTIDPRKEYIECSVAFT
jgi:hypothetical protein